METSCKRVDLTNVIRALPVRLLGSFASLPQTANARFAASISGPPAPGLGPRTALQSSPSCTVMLSGPL